MSSPCRVLVAGAAGWLWRDAPGICARAELVPAGPPVGFGGLVDAVARLRPQVVVLDLEEGGAAALAAIEAVMADQPTPILLVAPLGADRQEAIRAMAAGALDVLERPGRELPEFAAVLRDRARLLAKVKVVVHPRGKRQRRAERARGGRPAFHLVAIAASLGGPRALAVLLKGLPRDFPAPLVVCQHITPGFAEDLSRWLSAECRRDVREARGGETLEPGVVFVAPSNAHLRVRGDARLALDDGAPVGGFRPSCDVLLSSAAAAFQDRCVGVVLTGMGRDGAQGLLEVRQRGGHTVAQDEATSVVYGMPGEAVAAGAAEAVLPLDQIASRIARWVRA